MSEQEEPRQEEPQKDEHGCLTNEVWNEQQNKCVPKPLEPAETGPEAEKGTLEQRVFSAMEKIMKAKCAATEQQILKNVDSVLDAKARTVDLTLRKGFGIPEPNSVVHMSDLIGIGRKAALEKADTGKRTPAIEQGGPEGTIPPDAVQKMFRDARRGDSVESR